MTIYLEGTRGELIKVKPVAIVKGEYCDGIRVEILETKHGYSIGEEVETMRQWLVTNPEVRGCHIYVTQAKISNNLPTVFK